MTKEEILRKYTYQPRVHQVWLSVRKSVLLMRLLAIVCVPLRLITGAGWTLIPFAAALIVCCAWVLYYQGLRKQYEAQCETIRRLEDYGNDWGIVGRNPEGRPLLGYFVFPKKR